MIDVTKLYEPGTISESSHPHLALKVNGSEWMMVSCTQVSGQSSFRSNAKDGFHFRTEQHEQYMKDGKYGVTNCGWVRAISQRVSHAELINKTNELLMIFGKKPLRNAFVTIDQLHPVVSDAKHGVKITWNSSGYRSPVTVTTLSATKCYRILEDPCVFDSGGRLLTPLAKVMERINEHFVQFADPFAIKQRGTKNVRDVITISPGQRNQARKRTRKVKNV